MVYLTIDNMHLCVREICAFFKELAKWRPLFTGAGVPT